MKELSWILLLVLFCNPGFSQTGSLQKEINEQVWKPFIKPFNNDDGEAFSAVHSKEVIRLLQDDNRVAGYDEYFQMVTDSAKAKWADWKKKHLIAFCAMYCIK